MPITGSRTTRTIQRSLVPLSAELLRIDIDRDDVEDQDQEPETDASSASLPAALQLLRDRLLLREEIKILAPARLRIRARHVEAAERDGRRRGAGALAVQVQVADEELALAARQPLARRASRASRSGRTPCRSPRRSPPRSSRTLSTASTGPKISSRARRACGGPRPRPWASRSSPAFGPAWPPATIRPSFFPTSTYSRIFFWAPSLMTAPMLFCRVPDVAHGQGLRLRDDPLEQVVVHLARGR